MRWSRYDTGGLLRESGTGRAGNKAGALAATLNRGVLTDVESILPERRHAVTDDEKKLLIGDELTTSSTALAAFCFPGQDRAPQVFSDFLAHLLGRATVLASSAVLGVIKPVNAEIEQMNIRMRTLGERIDGLERRQNTNTTRVGELNLRVNGRAEQADKLADQLTANAGDLDVLTQLVYKLASEVEQLKSRAQGDEQPG